jgi:chemotaxis protein CheZ
MSSTPQKMAWAEEVELLKGALHTSEQNDGLINILERMVQMLSGELKQLDHNVLDELKNISQYINHAKVELNTIHPQELTSTHIQKATDELDAVIKATEDATGSILDAVEMISNVSLDCDSEKQEKLLEAVTKIYEACNFQDITGQIITRVVTTMRHVETKVNDIISVLGNREQLKNDGLSDPKEHEVKDDKSLLSGPQLKGAAPNQDDIDALFNA